MLYYYQLSPHRHLTTEHMPRSIAHEARMGSGLHGLLSKRHIEGSARGCHLHRSDEGVRTVTMSAGSGTNLAGGCDLIVASPEARFVGRHKAEEPGVSPVPG